MVHTIYCQALLGKFADDVPDVYIALAVLSDSSESSSNSSSGEESTDLTQSSSHPNKDLDLNLGAYQELSKQQQTQVFGSSGQMTDLLWHWE